MIDDISKAIEYWNSEQVLKFHKTQLCFINAIVKLNFLDHESGVALYFIWKLI
jgi:hypothetical protein